MKRLFSPLVLFLAMNTIGTAADAANPAEKPPLKEFQAGMVNVLELGVKNDGSEDVSEIVNQYTGKYSLYFPGGIYKVEKPLFLKNPIVGDGYARVPTITKARTWLVSAIVNEDHSVGVVNFSGNDKVNMRELNIKCNSHECGIRIGKCAQSTATFIDRVGIYNMRSYGLFIEGGGSRPIFAQNMTIFAANDWPVPCVAIYNGRGVNDNRFSNIEMMGIRVGLENHGAYTYGNNLHIWTGCMPQRDNGTWWRGTRGIVQADTGYFVGSEIYPDTCFYALEQRTANCSIDITNIMYWEDGSLRDNPDFDGAFFHCPEGCNGTLKIHGGAIGATGNGKTKGHMAKVYTPNQPITDVVIRTDYPISGEYIDKICFGNQLPDYAVHYKNKGYCKVADIFTVAKTGACEGILTLGDGAAWRLTFVKDASGVVEKTVAP
ncbi:MAG: hypothetical protein IKS67_03260, partial [Victivallales bacterium]|nr:hypothetical protein [Victivallales bacterium]